VGKIPRGITMRDFRTLDSEGKPLRLFISKNSWCISCEQTQYLKEDLSKALVKYVFTKEELKFIFESILNRYNHYGETSEFVV